MRSSRHNRFYHAMLTDVHRQALAQRLTVNDMEYLKQGLKKLDENYPKVDGIPESTATITDKELVHHIEFIIMYLGQYSITPNFVDEEWNRLVNQYKDRK